MAVYQDELQQKAEQVRQFIEAISLIANGLILLWRGYTLLKAIHEQQTY